VVSANDPVGKLAAVIAQGSLSEKQNAFATMAGVASPSADAFLGTWLADLRAGKVPEELRLDVLEAARKHPALQAEIARYEASLDPKDDIGPWRVALKGGNAEEGRKIFFEKAEVSCLRCHKAAGEGGEVGPELTGIITRKDRAYIVQSILRPNAEIAQGFENLLVTMKNGTAYAGVIKSETKDELVINSPEDGLLKLKLSEIASREKGLSGMPEGFGDQLSKLELRNLVEFLASLK
jgi:quinoprotein glucose dehydrogenase